MQAGVMVPNTYRSARALTAIGVMEMMQGKVTPRSLFDADLGQGTANPHDRHLQVPKQAATPPPFFPVLLNGSVSTVLEQAREFAKAGVGVMDLVLDFGGLSIDEILANLHRLGNDVLPTLHTFPS